VLPSLRNGKREETIMTSTHPVDESQQALWNGSAGQAWVDAQETLDAVLRPFEDILVGTVAAGPGGRVLDVGCGTGSTTLAIARQLGAHGQATGVDISAPMLALARARAERERATATFLCADAQTHPFEPASHDMIVSRFGVMFFADPVQAFANLRRAAALGGALHVIVWQSAEKNPFMTTAERTAAALLPELPARRADGPGQFAFADADHVRHILEQSGWAEHEIRPIEVTCTMPESELLGYVTRLGPLGRILPALDDRRRVEVVETVRAAFDPYVDGAEVRFTAACWSVGARAR
jgi:ubiquinone/menaquinone biosynthesis C-methylase UbiE